MHSFCSGMICFSCKVSEFSYFDSSVIVVFESISDNVLRPERFGVVVLPRLVWGKPIKARPGKKLRYIYIYMHI